MQGLAVSKDRGNARSGGCSSNTKKGGVLALVERSAFPNSRLQCYQPQ